MQETLTVENITKSDILSILEPYRKKKPYLLPQGWSINMEGRTHVPSGTTMRIWIKSVEYTIPYTLGYCTVIKALGHLVSRSSIIIVYVYNRKNISIVVALKKKK